MPRQPRSVENLVTLTYRSTHSYLVGLSDGKLMVDAGWAGSLPALQSQLRAYQIASAAIRFVLITHTHPDHAGLAQTVKRWSGARLLIHAKQIVFLPQLEAFFAAKGGYEPIRVEARDVVLTAGNRPVLDALGIDGEVIETPGHSDDSVSLVLDSGLAFTGDLHLPQFAVDEAAAVLTRASWQRLLEHGARVFYPAHGSHFTARVVQQALADWPGTSV